MPTAGNEPELGATRPPCPRRDDALRPGASTDSTEPNWERIRFRLEAFAVKLIWNRHDAEEIVQESFRLSLTNGLELANADAMPWLMRTVANLCMNLRRRRHPEALNDHLEPVTHGGPMDSAMTAERIHALRDRIAALPNQQRLAITLRMLEALSYEEAARVMELSAAAVRTHVHLARKALAESLKEYRP